MVGTSDRKLSTVHFGSASTIKTVPLPFVPQSMTISGQSTFYVGGSDRYGGAHSSPVGANTLQAFDVLCNPLPAAPVFVGSVYATAAAASAASGCAYDGGHGSSRRSVLAAAGFTPTTDVSSLWQTQHRIDVYLDPPIRSFSLSI